jgi:thiamine biosynthesis lipoprotein
MPPAGSLQGFRRSELHMGVEFEVVVYAPAQAAAEGALDAAFARIAELDRLLSDYDPASELSRLSQSSSPPQRPPGAPPVPVSVGPDLWTVLSFAQEVSQATDGAFDVTIGPLTRLWRRARRRGELPDAADLAQARAAVGYQALQLDRPGRQVILHKPQMRLDLGGIAKGYAADEAVRAVQKLGIPRVLARASGDIAAADPPPGERGWLVGIAPLDPDQPPQRMLWLTHRAVSTSGDARQHLVVAGRRYSHILDPRTGEPVHGRSSVTVVSPIGMLADSLATACSVVGPEAALRLMTRFPGSELLMVHEDEQGRPTQVQSPGFWAYEAPPAVVRAALEAAPRRIPNADRAPHHPK